MVYKDIEAEMERLSIEMEICQCCGGPKDFYDPSEIGPECLSKHWSKHAKGINYSRCRTYNRNAIAKATS
tara:strand:- start:2365 stop:2574 length:210 start_codon:yes stop_codon:yes gene_type:complete